MVYKCGCSRPVGSTLQSELSRFVYYHIINNNRQSTASTFIETSQLALSARPLLCDIVPVFILYVDYYPSLDYVQLCC